MDIIADISMLETKFAKFCLKTDVAYDYAQWSEPKSLSEKCILTEFWLFQTLSLEN